MTKPDIPYHLHRPEKDLPLDFDEPCAFTDYDDGSSCTHARRSHHTRTAANGVNVTYCDDCVSTPAYTHYFVQGVTRQ